MGVRKADDDINEQAWPGFDDVDDEASSYYRLLLYMSGIFHTNMFSIHKS